MGTAIRFLLIFCLSITQLWATELPSSVEKIAIKLGLLSVVTGAPLTFPNVHASFENESGGFALAVFDVPGNLRNTQLLQADDYVIVQIPNEEKSAFHSLAISGIEYKRVQEALKEEGYTQFKFPSLIINYAYAYDCRGIAHPLRSSSIGQLSDSYNTNYLTIAKDCVYSTLQGAWDATGGAAVNFANGVRSLFNDPRAFWDSRVQEFREIKQFFLEFDTRIQSMWATLKKLPPEALANIICGFVGGVAAGVATGSLVASLTPKLTQFFMKLMKLTKAITLLERMGKIGKIPKQFYSRLTSGAVSESRILSMSKLAEHEMGNLVEGAMACAL